MARKKRAKKLARAAKKKWTPVKKIKEIERARRLIDKKAAEEFYLGLVPNDYYLDEDDSGVVYPARGERDDEEVQEDYEPAEYKEEKKHKLWVEYEKPDKRRKVWNYKKQIKSAKAKKLEARKEENARWRSEKAASKAFLMGLMPNDQYFIDEDDDGVVHPDEEGPDYDDYGNEISKKDIIIKIRNREKRKASNYEEYEETKKGKAEIEKILKMSDLIGNSNQEQPYNAQFTCDVKSLKDDYVAQLMGSANIILDGSFFVLESGERIGTWAQAFIENDQGEGEIIPLVFYRLAIELAQATYGGSAHEIVGMSNMRLTHVAPISLLDIKLKGEASNDETKITEFTFGDMQTKWGNSRTRLARAMANGYSLMDSKIDTGVNECAIDYIWWALKKSNEGRVRQEFKKLIGNRNLLIQEIGSSTPTGKQIVDFCIAKKISVHIIDPFTLQFVRHVEKDKLATIYFMITNEHCYPITDPELINCIRYYGKLQLGKITAELHITEYNSVAITEQELSQYIGKYDERVSLSNPAIGERDGAPKTIIVKEVSDLSKIAVDVMKKTKTLVVKMLTNKFGMTMFQHPTTGQFILASMDYDGRKSACDAFSAMTNNMGLRWQNQSYAQLGMEFLKCINGVIPESNYSPDLHNILEKSPIRAYAFAETTDATDAVSIDVCKCYTGALLNSKHLWPIAEVHDSIKEFDGNITVGEYLIGRKFTTAQGNMHFNGGWYPHNFVEHLLERGHIEYEDITHQIKMKKALPAKHFVKFVETVREVCPDEAKHIINQVVGVLGKKYSREYYGAIATSELSAYALMGSHIKNGRSEVSVCGVAGMFVARMCKKELLGSGNILIQRQVMVQAFIDLDLAADELIGPDTEFLGVKTDSMQLRNPLPYDFKDDPQPGDLRLESRATLFKQLRGDDTNSGGYYLPDVDEERQPVRKLPGVWAGRDEGKGALRLGPAGSGKSTEIVRLDDKDTIVLTFTNVAVHNLIARGVKAKTFHKFFNMDGKNDRFDYKTLCKYNKVMIDEISMTPNMFIRAMVMAKMTKPSMVFRLYGDLNQCPSVEKNSVFYDLNYSSAIRFIVDGVLAPMQFIDGCMRYDDPMRIMLTKFLDDGMWTYRSALHRGAFFITKHTDKRDELNAEYALRYIKKHNVLETIKMSDGLGAVGMPVVSHLNEDKIKVTNNEIGEITSLEDGVTVTIGEREIKMTDAMFRKVFKLYFGANVHRLQAMTLDHKVNIHEAGIMTRNELYTAASRLTKLDDLGIERFSNKEYKLTSETDAVKIIKVEPTNKPAVIYKATGDFGVVIGQAWVMKGETNIAAAKRDVKYKWKKLNILRKGLVHSQKQLSDIMAHEIESHVCINKPESKVPKFDTTIISPIVNKAVKKVMNDAEIEYWADFPNPNKAEAKVYSKYRDDTRWTITDTHIRVTATKGDRKTWRFNEANKYSRMIEAVKLLEAADS